MENNTKDEEEKFLFNVSKLTGSLVEWNHHQEIKRYDPSNPSSQKPGYNAVSERSITEKEMYKRRIKYERSIYYPPIKRESINWDPMQDYRNEPYHPCPESINDSSTIPIGSIKSFRSWMPTTTSKYYPNMKWDLFIYTPKQLMVETNITTNNNNSPPPPPGIFFFTDGLGYMARQGIFHAPEVMNTMIANKEIPISVGIFLMPGRPIECLSSRELLQKYGSLDKIPYDPRVSLQRQVEYDRCTDAYSNFLNDEVIPFCEDYVGKTFTTDPKKRMIVGISSGGNAAFTAAWHHPHLWGKVLSHVSFFFFKSDVCICILTR